jgi:hypothetical protein
MMIAAALAAVLCANAAVAAPSTLLVTLYADRATPYMDPADGTAHPFMCLTPVDQNAGKPECFGFYPRGGAITSVQLSDGGTLTKREDGWFEAPGGSHYSQIPGPADNVVLRDAARGLTLTLSVPRGGSLISQNGDSRFWRKVTGITFAPAAPSFIGSDWPNSDFQERPTPWEDAGLKFSLSINAARRTDLLSIMRNWNSRAPRMTTAEMTDFLDIVAATIGAKRPPRSSGQTPADYIQALISANRRSTGVFYNDSIARTPATKESRSPPSNR